MNYNLKKYNRERKDSSKNTALFCDARKNIQNNIRIP